MKWRPATLSVLGGALFGLLCFPALAAESAKVVMSSNEIELEESEGTLSGPVTLTNLTTEDLEITASLMKPDPGCTLTPNPDKLPPAQESSVILKVSAGCSIPDDGLNAAIVVPESGSLSILLNDKKPASPDWNLLRAFPIAWILGIVVCLGVVLVWKGTDENHKEEPEPPEPGPYDPPPVPIVPKPPEVRNYVDKLQLELPGLQTGWVFSENWASNVTVAGTALAAVVASSEVLTALAGEKPEAVLSLALVAGAIATAFVVVAPLILIAFRGKGGVHLKVYALVLATATTIAGAGGQVWVLSTAAGLLDLGGIQKWIQYSGYGAILLLAAYLWSSVRKNLNDGLKVSQIVISDEVRSAWIIAHAIRYASEGKVLEPPKIEDLEPFVSVITGGLRPDRRYFIDPRPTALI